MSETSSQRRANVSPEVVGLRSDYCTRHIGWFRDQILAQDERMADTPQVNVTAPYAGTVDDKGWRYEVGLVAIPHAREWGSVKFDADAAVWAVQSYRLEDAFLSASDRPSRLTWIDAYAPSDTVPASRALYDATASCVASSQSASVQESVAVSQVRAATERLDEFIVAYGDDLIAYGDDMQRLFASEEPAFAGKVSRVLDDIAYGVEAVSRPFEATSYR